MTAVESGRIDLEDPYTSLSLCLHVKDLERIQTRQQSAKFNEDLVNRALVHTKFLADSGKSDFFLYTVYTFGKASTFMSFGPPQVLNYAQDLV